jgi:16S rRNA (cytosine1407-C5)-methyltransferase
MREVFFKLPKGFFERLKEIYPNHYQNILESFLAKKPTTFRINYLKTDLVTLRNKLIQEGIRFNEPNFPKGAFILKSSFKDLQHSLAYAQGLIYVQNVSSMLSVIVLEPAPSDKILDLCAAPGAKTTQIASMAKDAEIIAFEKEHIRHCKLQANLKIQGAGFVKTFAMDGFWVRKKFPEYFDKILADVPCSAEGLFDLNNPRSYKYWKEKKVRELMHKQKDLLHSAFFALKPGGILVYSTCTISPEENEEVINWFLDKFKDKVEILPISLPLNNVYHGLTSWQKRQYSAALRFTKRILPNEFMEAFFIAKLRKSV